PDNSTAVPITPSGTVTVKPPPVAWWVFSASKPGDVRVFHGTELAAMGACATCIYTPYGPYSTKSAAETVAARNRDKIRAQLAAMPLAGMPSLMLNTTMRGSDEADCTRPSSADRTRTTTYFLAPVEGIMISKAVAVLALAASCLLVGVPPSLAGSKSSSVATP